jgi:hypothetical protein
LIPQRAKPTILSRIAEPPAACFNLRVRRAL